MSRPIIKRSSRPLTSEERARVRLAYEQVEAEKDELITNARRHRYQLASLHEARKLLREEREAQGLSLADLAERTGLTRSALCRLETAPKYNPTVMTLQKVANALGRSLIVTLQ